MPGETWVHYYHLMSENIYDICLQAMEPCPSWLHELKTRPTLEPTQNLQTGPYSASDM